MTSLANLLEAFQPRSHGGKPVHEGLIIFTRYPEPGKTKTRLIPTLGQDGAAELHRRMTEQTLTVVKQFQNDRPVSVEVWYEGGSQPLVRQWLGSDIPAHPQGRGDLGERMARAFRETFNAGMNRVVLMGTDIPEITVPILRAAFENLGSADVVLGPAYDGGYYLIGLRKPFPQLFVDVPWGTGEVLQRTWSIAEHLGLSVMSLDTLADIDRTEDLHRWKGTSIQIPGSHYTPRISIIIPTLNEGVTLPGTLASTQNGSNVEIIIVDGGSTDETVEVAQSWGIEVVVCPPGRARQMNVGASRATGELFLFLHGDTRLPEGYDSHIRATLKRPRTVAGAFQLRIDGRLPGLRTAERLVNLRSQHLKFPYGDQAIFLRADLFWDMGGFPEMPIMEDFELVRRLRRRGRIVTAPIPVLTSARRWERLGIVRTTLLNYSIPLAYFLGTPLSILARWYQWPKEIQGRRGKSKGKEQ